MRTRVSFPLFVFSLVVLSTITSLTASAQPGALPSTERLKATPFMDARPLSTAGDSALLALLDSAAATEGIRPKTDSYWTLRRAGTPVDVVPLSDAAHPGRILLLYYLPETAQHFFMQLERNDAEQGRAEIRLWTATEPKELLMTEEGIAILEDPSPFTFRFASPAGPRRASPDALSLTDIFSCVTRTLGFDVTTASWSQLIGSLSCSATNLFATYETVTNCISMLGVGANNASAPAGCFGGVAYLIACGYMNCSTAGRGTLQVKAVLNSNSSWTGPVNCAFSGASGGNVTQVPVSLSVPAGQYTLQCSGGPGTLTSITPSNRQSLTANGTIAFTLNYTQAAAAAPTFSPAPGTYNGPVSVGMYSATSGATIRYTLNGADPTLSSAVYTGPITLSSSMTVRAKAFRSGMADSPAVSATYTIRAPLSVACSVYPNPAHLYQTITWQAQAQGGSGSYSYGWLNGITASAYSKTYSATGTISNWVVITDRVTSQSKTAYCSLSVIR